MTLPQYQEEIMAVRPERPANSSAKRGGIRGLSKHDRPNRVTKEMNTAARIAVRKAIEEAKKARLRGNRSRP